MKIILSIFTLFICHQSAMSQKISFEKNQNTTATYEEVISFYTELDRRFAKMKLLTAGPTDIGLNLNLVVLSDAEIFDPVEIRRQNKRIILINNGIHPGEPEGIDASMMLCRDLLEKDQLPKNVVICIIPVYNIDGMLNRGTSRANQNGPEQYGFRGNSRNLDLNRDFIKTDSRNSASFQSIFTQWSPDVFVDTHTSNGADYQYVMTLIHPQKDKLNPVLSDYASKTFIPDFYREMKKSGYEMIPYVNSIEETPDKGISGFLEIPRYSTGYAALHNTIGFMPETHMLKPFELRVKSTYQLLLSAIRLVQRDAEQIGQVRAAANESVQKQTLFPLNWVLDPQEKSPLDFKGYQAKYKKSEITGEDRLFYDRNEPYQKKIVQLDKYVPTIAVKKPLAYIIPQAWEKVIDLLRINGVSTQQLGADVETEVEMYYITDYKSLSRPFEGHYVHSAVKVHPVRQKLKFFKGDYVVLTNQVQNRYIVETLEPQGVDSFFAWNFFDSILGQKEHYSDYVFEDDAALLSRENVELMKRFEQKKLDEPDFAKNKKMQLNWWYEQSPYFEKTFMRYPIGRLESTGHLKLN